MIYLKLFLEFFKIGLFTFGGGYAMIPLIKEVVLKYNWLTEEQFYSFIGVCEATPGPIAVNMATYVGSIKCGFLGSLVASLGVVLPSFIIIILVITVLKKLLVSKIFKNALKGIKPVVIALVLSAGIVMFAKNLGYISISVFSFDYLSLIIFGVICVIYYGFKILFKKKINPIIIIIISGVLGVIASIILL